MVKENILLIHIPEIVLNEFKTQKYEDINKSLKTRDLENTVNLFNYDPTHIGGLLKQIKIGLSDLQHDIESDYDKEVNEWIKDFQINILKFDPIKIDNVMKKKRFMYLQMIKCFLVI